MMMIDGDLPKIAPADFVWEWVSSSLPWIDPLKEAQAQILLLGANLESEIHILKQQGREFEDVIAERKRAMEMIQAAGLAQAMQQHQAALNASILNTQEAA